MPPIKIKCAACGTVIETDTSNINTKLDCKCGLSIKWGDYLKLQTDCDLVRIPGSTREFSSEPYEKWTVSPKAVKLLLLTLLTLIGGPLLLCLGVGSWEKWGAPSAFPNDGVAIELTQNAVRNILRYPEESEFAWGVEVRKLNATTMFVAGVVTTRNAFGMRTKYKYACNLRKDKSGKWRVGIPSLSEDR